MRAIDLFIFVSLGKGDTRCLGPRLTLPTLLALEGLELQSFSYHPALFLVAEPVFFLYLPYFSQPELCGGVVIRSVHQCGHLSSTDVGSVSLPT
eukprot:375305-Pelagomonas_calceolata.AAC.3